MDETIHLRVETIMLTIIIISYEVAWSIDDVRDGLTHRYYGLYSNLAKYIIEHEGKAFWYSAKEHKLLAFDPNTSLSLGIYSMSVGLTKALRNSLTYSRPVIVLLDYPHSFLGVKHFVDYVLTLLLLHVFRLIKNVFVVVDNMDPPVEHAIELRGRINLLERILWILLNKLIFSLDLLVFHSQSYRIFHKQYYHLNYEKSIVIPPGSFPKVIRYEELPSYPPIRILCSGRVTEWIDIVKFLGIIEELKRRGIITELILFDKSANENLDKESIKVIKDYIVYKDFAKNLAKAHFLLLIRPDSLHHFLTVRASLADYLMTGRPLIYLRSLGMREIVKDIDGIFEFNTLDEVPNIILQLISNGTLIRKLSREIRAFAENRLSYKVLALKLLREILENFRRKIRA